MRKAIERIRQGLLIALFAALTIGAFSCAEDDDDAQCQQGTIQCENDKKIVCLDGKWKATNVACNSNGGNNNSGGNNNGGNNNGGNGNACAELDAGQSCSACTPVCSADGSTAYLCNTKTGKSMKWTCANNDCAVNGTKVTCTKASGGGGNGGGGNGGGGNGSSNVCQALDAGQSCSACTPACSADGSTAYLCNTKTGKSMKWKCANNDCAVNGTKVTCTKLAACKIPQCRRSHDKTIACLCR